MFKSTEIGYNVQRCVNARTNKYEDWPGYCERLMTRSELLKAVEECERKWPDYEFRGHNVAKQAPGSDSLRVIT